MENHQPVISFIVSVYDRVEMLNACLATLAVQECPKEIIVCCNHPDQDIVLACGIISDDYGAVFKNTGAMGAIGPYESAEIAALEAKGDWLCFPSDDSLYVQKFAEIMLAAAYRETAEGVSSHSDLVYCDCVYHRPDEPRWKPYTVLSTEPRMGKIDKTCFILRRKLFDGFPQHPGGWSDGALIEQLVRDSVKHAKAPGVLCIHQ